MGMALLSLLEYMNRHEEGDYIFGKKYKTEEETAERLLLLQLYLNTYINNKYNVNIIGNRLYNILTFYFDDQHTVVKKKEIIIINEIKDFMKIKR